MVTWYKTLVGIYLVTTTVFCLWKSWVDSCKCWLLFCMVGNYCWCQKQTMPLLLPLPHPNQITSIQKYFLYIWSFLGWWSYLLYKLFRLISFFSQCFHHCLPFYCLKFWEELSLFYIWTNILIFIILILSFFLKPFLAFPSRLMSFYDKIFLPI